MKSFKLEEQERELDWSLLGGCLTFVVGYSLIGLAAFALFCVFPPVAILYAVAFGVFLVRK